MWNLKEGVASQSSSRSRYETRWIWENNSDKNWNLVVPPQFVRNNVLGSYRAPTPPEKWLVPRTRAATASLRPAGTNVLQTAAISRFVATWMQRACSGRPLRDPNGERLSTALISYVRLVDDLPRREPYQVSPLDGPRGLIPDHQWGASRHPGILSRHDTDVYPCILITSFPAINSTYVDDGAIRAPAWRNTRKEPPANQNKCRSDRISRARPVIPLYPIVWWISMKQFLSIYSVQLRMLMRKKWLNERRS